MLCGNKVDLRSLAKSKGMNIITTEDGERLAKVARVFFAKLLVYSSGFRGMQLDVVAPLQL